MNTSKGSGFSIRKILRQANCARVGSTSLYSLLVNLATTGRASAQSLRTDSRYKALVCLFLDGGNDSFNMLVPLEPAEYSTYRRARADLALQQEQLLEIIDTSAGETGRRFGIHPGMPEIRDLYNAGNLSFVCNVGTLIEPTTLATVADQTAKLPLGLYSHSDQLMHWQTATPDKRGSTGWAGRAAEVLRAMNENERISMNISLSGTNVFQSGKNLIPYSITPNGVSLLDGYSDPNRLFFRKAVDSMLEQQYQNLFKQTYAGMTRSSIEASHVFLDAWNNAPPVTTTFPETQLSQSFRGIARSIAAREQLGMKRQTYFVRHCGWDHHDEVLDSQAVSLTHVSQAVGAFWRALGELGVQDDVLLFTASDFGRTLSSNGKGSDHGWGGNQFVLGGGHKGGRLYGQYPENLELGNDLDTGRGRLIPTTSVDEYFCELALWLGMPKSDIPVALPNIERFHDLKGATPPMGFFN